MFKYAHPRPAVTATIALVTHDNHFLCGLRGRKDSAFSGYYCIPGGFMDPLVEEGDMVEFDENLLSEGETIEETAIREIFEETGIVITEDRLQLAKVKSNPKTDPRCHVVNICYYVRLTAQEEDDSRAGDDLAELATFTHHEISNMTLAFNHNEIVDDVWEIINGK